MAWTILSLASNVCVPFTDLTLPFTSVSQAVIAQDRRDRRILDLLEIMDNVYALVLDAGPLKKIQSQKHAVEMLVKQTTECAYFISHYFNTPNFCECLRLGWKFCTLTDSTSLGLRLGKNVIGDVDTKIAGFESSFTSLRATFTEGVALNTELFVLRMVSDIETIGKRDVLSTVSTLYSFCPTSCGHLLERLALR
jgi:hypothetical protein